MLRLPGIRMFFSAMGTSLVLSMGAELDGRWTWSNPRPHQTGWRDIAFGNGIFVASTTGHGGHYLYCSADGVSWDELAVPTRSVIWHLKYVNGRFIGTTEDGVLTSVDGWNWTGCPLKNYALNDVAYGNGTYVAVGTVGSIAISTDGENWSLHRLPVEAPFGPLLGVAYGNGRFVTIGGWGYLFTSEDGRKWTQHPWPEGLEVAEHYRVALSFYDGQFFYSSGYSTDGVNWQLGVSRGIKEGTVCTGDGTLVACNYSGLATSDDGFAWLPVLGTAPGENLTGVAYGNGRYVAVGERGLRARSNDSREWEVVRPSWGGPWKVAFGNGCFLRYGGTNLYRSTDGKEWKVLAIPEPFVDILHGNGEFIASGPSAVIYRSTDGADWKSEGGSVPQQFLGGLFLRSFYDGTISVSRDARAWQEAEITKDDRIKAIAYGSGRFLAVGESFTYTSRDALSWERLTRSPRSGFRLTFGNGRFLFAGQAGMGPTTLYITEDGREWIETRAGATHQFDGFGFAAGHFLMLDQWGAVHFSKDGLSWQHNRLTEVPLQGFAEGNGALVVTGVGNTALRKQLEENPSRWLPLEIDRSAEGTLLELFTTAKASVIESSSDLALWQPAAAFNSDSNDSKTISISRAAGNKAQFYRAREVDLD
jgi:hypothetical protein